MRKVLTTTVVALAFVICSAAMAAPLGAAPAVLPPGGGGGSWPSGCRDLDISTSESSFLFHTTVYRFHALEHWCWGGGGI